ncbi:MAG: hypothetical protein R3D33_05915 [Hyphomicrobiaceae bacterium]
MFLFNRKPDIEAVHLLADHLEAVLNLAEEMRRYGFAPRDAAGLTAVETMAELARLDDFVARLEDIEMAMLAKIGHARRSATRLARADQRLQPFAQLFSAGTQALIDAVPRITDPSEDHFNHRGQALVFLKQRNLIEDDRGNLDGVGELRVASDFRVIGFVTLETLAELCNSCLTALDTHYGLYEREDEPPATAIAPAPAGTSEAAGPIVAVTAAAPDLAADELSAPGLPTSIATDAPATGESEAMPVAEGPARLGDRLRGIAGEAEATGGDAARADDTVEVLRATVNHVEEAIAEAAEPIAVPAARLGAEETATAVAIALDASAAAAIAAIEDQDEPVDLHAFAAGSAGITPADAAANATGDAAAASSLETSADNSLAAADAPAPVAPRRRRDDAASSPAPVRNRAARHGRSSPRAIRASHRRERSRASHRRERSRPAIAASEAGRHRRERSRRAARHGRAGRRRERCRAGCRRERDRRSGKAC